MLYSQLVFNLNCFQFVFLYLDLISPYDTIPFSSLNKELNLLSPMQPSQQRGHAVFSRPEQHDWTKAYSNISFRTKAMLFCAPL